MTVGQRYYTGTENLVIKVMADSFESDPDVYIFKNGATNAQWYCEKEGSETCVLHSGEFAVGDSLKIEVRCVQECTYKLRTWYSNVINLADSTQRTQMRFDAYSTQFMKFYIPAKTIDDNLDTTSIFLRIEPEDDATRIEMFLSLDSYFYLIEEKPAVHILKDGLAIKFGKQDFAWCVKCWVYAIINIYVEQRYYLTSSS